MRTATILAAIILATVVGCQGTVPGGGIHAEFIKADGTRVMYDSSKDVSAKSITFTPSSGELKITELNTNASKLGIEGQLPLGVRQSDNTATVLLPITTAIGNAVSKATLGGGGATSVDTNALAAALVAALKQAGVTATTQPVGQ